MDKIWQFSSGIGYWKEILDPERERRNDRKNSKKEKESKVI